MERLLLLREIVQNLYGALAQLGERGLCKPEVRGSIPLCSTINCTAGFSAGRFCSFDIKGVSRPKRMPSHDAKIVGRRFYLCLIDSLHVLAAQAEIESLPYENQVAP